MLIDTTIMDERSGVRIPTGQESFSSWRRFCANMGLTELLILREPGLFLGCKRWGCKVTTHLYLVPRVGMGGAIQINPQPDATIFQFIILKFVYSSTCFGRFPAHHQELNDCSGSLWFYLPIVVTIVLCSW